MLRIPLAVFTPDRQTGSMKELTPGELTPYALTRDPTVVRHLSVLVVDNNDAELQLTIRHLAAAWPFARDLVVDCAANAVEAVEKIRRYVYAFVVLDWKEPLPTGLDVLQSIRADGLRVPVVVVSAKGREAIASDLESLGVAFVNKRELNPTRFCNAIAAAILWTQRVFGLVRAVPLHTCKSARLSAHVVGDSFEKRSSPLPVRLTAFDSGREARIAVGGARPGNPTGFPRMAKAVRKQLSVAVTNPRSPVLVGGSAPPARRW